MKHAPFLIALCPPRRAGRSPTAPRRSDPFVDFGTIRTSARSAMRSSICRTARNWYRATLFGPCFNLRARSASASTRYGDAPQSSSSSTAGRAGSIRWSQRSAAAAPAPTASRVVSSSSARRGAGPPRSPAEEGEAGGSSTVTRTGSPRRRRRRDGLAEQADIERQPVALPGEEPARRPADAR